MTIDSSVFENCKKLESITIPVSVTNIRNDAFGYCSSLKTIMYKGTVAEWKAMSRGSYWKRGATSSTVYCTDGNVTV